MKAVMAFIRIDKMNVTKKALTKAGISSLTATGHVSGRGKGMWDAKVLEGVRENKPEAIELLGKEPRLRPQRTLFLAVPDDKVNLTVETIMEANHTGNPGDGKIFVMPLGDSIRVRTGEAGEEVLD